MYAWYNERGRIQLLYWEHIQQYVRYRRTPTAAARQTARETRKKLLMLLLLQWGTPRLERKVRTKRSNYRQQYTCYHKLGCEGMGG